MKKTALILAIFILAFSIASCGGNGFEGKYYQNVNPSIAKNQEIPYYEFNNGKCVYWHPNSGSSYGVYSFEDNQVEIFISNRSVTYKYDAKTDALYPTYENDISIENSFFRKSHP